MIALIDYGIGNLRSVEKALQAAGELQTPIQISSEPAVILAADKVVLPGVGAFGDGMAGLRERRLVEVVLEVARRGTPLLGICVGMQLLFEVGEEMGEHGGLGLLPGRVRRFDLSPGPSPRMWRGEDATPGSRGENPPLPPLAKGGGGEALKIPQTGWNQLQVERPSPLLDGFPPASYAYFNHSYYCDAAEAGDVLASTWYGLRYASAVGRGRVYGVQFHPEKSQAVGLLLLRNFIQHG